MTQASFTCSFVCVCVSISMSMYASCGVCLYIASCSCVASLTQVGTQLLSKDLTVRWKELHLFTLISHWHKFIGRCVPVIVCNRGSLYVSGSCHIIWAAFVTDGLDSDETEWQQRTEAADCYRPTDGHTNPCKSKHPVMPRRGLARLSCLTGQPCSLLSPFLLPIVYLLLLKCTKHQQALIHVGSQHKP